MITANQIHISKESYELLMIFGGFEVEYRGTVEIKVSKILLLDDLFSNSSGILF